MSGIISSLFCYWKEKTDQKLARWKKTFENGEGKKTIKKDRKNKKKSKRMFFLCFLKKREIMLYIPHLLKF